MTAARDLPGTAVERGRARKSVERRRLLRALHDAGLAVIVPPLLLSACDTPPTRRGFPELTFQHLPKLRFDVSEIEVNEAYRSSGQPPHVEHLFPVRPAVAAANWARDRLAAAGTARRLRYIVREASVVEAPLPIEEGLKGAFVVQQSERYDAQMIVDLQMLGDDGALQGAATAKAARSVTVAENITLTERERIWFRLIEALMNDLDAQLEQTLRAVFAQDMLS